VSTVKCSVRSAGSTSWWTPPIPLLQGAVICAFVVAGMTERMVWIRIPVGTTCVWRQVPLSQVSWRRAQQLSAPSLRP
jgi:hypothetical protein